MIDSHLVMNVLNIMAARDFKENGRESPLLFALSDYLQVAFLQQEESRLALIDEIATLKVRVALLAEVQAGKIEVTLHNRGHAGWHVEPGALASVAIGLLGLARGSADRSARLVMTIDDKADEAGWVAVTVDMLELSPGAVYELPLAMRRLAPVLQTDAQAATPSPPPRWSQAHPAHLNLVYSVRVSTAT